VAHKLVLEGELADIIETCWKRREYTTEDGPALSVYVFHHECRPISEFRKSWARACYEAGLPCELIYQRDLRGNIVFRIEGDKKGEPVIEKIISKMVFHDLRRTGIRNMVRAGVREGVAMAISGHRTRSTFDRYNITPEDDPAGSEADRPSYPGTTGFAQSCVDQQELLILILQRVFVRHCLWISNRTMLEARAPPSAVRKMVFGNTSCSHSPTSANKSKTCGSRAAQP
jgi:hypothetical protein